MEKARIPGYVQASRLTRAGDTVALYAAASWWGEYINDDNEREHGSFTYVKSFGLTGGDIQAWMSPPVRPKLFT